MPIVSKLYPIASNLATSLPFSDWLNVTVPDPDCQQVINDLRPLLETLCMSFAGNELYLLPKGLGRGSFKYTFSEGFITFGASGGFLQHLRNFNMLGDYLMCFALHPHRVSRLDVALDFHVDAPAYVEDAYQIAKQGNMKLTRKHLAPSAIKQILSPNQYGADTGTVYLGHRKSASTSARIYDKAHERLQNDSMVIAPTLRIEFTFSSQVGCTLHDVTNPAEVFYQHASQSLVTPPETFKGWFPHAEGYYLEKTSPRPLKQRIQDLEMFSDDVIRYLKLKRELEALE